MELHELLKKLKKEADYLLESKGWNVAFEVMEDVENHYVLALKENLVRRDHLLLKTPSSNISKWKLVSFDSVYRERIEIDFSESRFRDFLLHLENDFNKIFQNTNLINIYNYFQKNNFSFIDTININNFFAIKNIELKNIKATHEIYFLGENGDGKSLILMGIYLAFNKSYIDRHTEKKYTGEVIDLVKQNEKLVLKGTDANGLHYGSGRGLYLKNTFAYGVHRGRYNTDNAEQYGFMTLFNKDLQLNNPISWLMYLYSLELEKRLDGANMISEEKNLPTTIPLKTVQDLFHELLEKNVTIEVRAEGVKFKEKGFELTFDQLSEGYKNLIIWVADLIFRLHKNQPDVEKLNELTGVVMVDEIELHLHPKWQRTLVSKLRNFFPNIQFIFTTHSPTIIQGASDEAIIYKVYRDNQTGHTHVSEPYYKKDLDNLMLNSLVTSPLFGLEDARLTNKPVSPDTSDTYALSRINKRVEAQLAQQKKNGKVYISDEEIDALVDQVLNEEKNGYGKDK